MNGVTLIIMGALSIICCPILGPITWYLSNQALTAGTATDLSQVNIARILGIIGTVVLILGIVARVAGIGAGIGVPGQ